jgi:cob(I)alamin adenosyltransferase
MKIYTKTGDTGQTSLLGGSRVPKHHLRIESYGTLDELNSSIGVVRDHTKHESIQAWLINIQETLFTLGAELATEPGNETVKIPHILNSDITWLENRIDEMDAILPPLKNFVLPGGAPVVSFCHVARCICRRAERITVHLAEEESAPEFSIQYLNRLSDFLFTLCRYFSLIENAKEIPWNPRK